MATYTAGTSSACVQLTCAYRVEKRGRQCRMVPCLGSSYCAEHLMHDQQFKGRSRVICPLDSSHTVFEDQLSKHLRKCNAAKKTYPPCYKKGVNSGQSEADVNSAESRFSLSECSEARLSELIKRVIRAYERECVAANVVMNGQCTHASLELINGTAADKHIKQQLSILKHMEKVELLLAADTAYIEFGAGRGGLSERIRCALRAPNNVQFVLVDKATCRRKADGALRSSGLNCYHRLLMDIVDLDLQALDLLSGVEHVVGIAKHLCGVATDFALRCLVNGPKLRGAVIALCCHHRVQWSHLTGSNYLESLGFNEDDFKLLSHMTSWAVCGVRGASEYTPHRNQDIGLMCKRLIDFARMNYVRKCGLNAQLVYYVSREVTLENVLLIVH